MSSRPSIFTENDDLDLSGFMPKAGPQTPPVPAETVHKVSEEGGFPSRSPKLRNPAAASPPKPSLAKSGRTQLLNARITPRALERFHSIVEVERQRYEAGEITHRVTLGEVVEQALAALERERTGQRGEKP
jgi:hypothetical protein